jgi:hypothetical protein
VLLLPSALQRWAQHNAELARARSGRAASTSGEGEEASSSRGAPAPEVESAPAAALAAWCGVSKSARAALKRANVQSVLEMEMTVLVWLEKASLLACCWRWLDALAACPPGSSAARLQPVAAV